MNTGDGNDVGAREVFARVDWKAVLPQLFRGARSYLRALGWAEGEHHRPAVLEAAELVNTVYVLFRSGQRPLPLARCQDDDGVVRVLSKAMFNVSMGRYRLAAVSRHEDGDDLVDAQPDEQPTASRRFRARQLFERLSQLHQGDAEALRVLGAFAEGHLTPDDIAEHLRWDKDDTRVVLRRMARHRAYAHLTLNDDGEAEPPSSGPHWSHDGTRERTGRRHRSSHEPDHGARLAGRGRRPGR